MTFRSSVQYQRKIEQILRGGGLQIEMDLDLLAPPRNSKKSPSLPTRVSYCTEEEGRKREKEGETLFNKRGRWSA